MRPLPVLSHISRKTYQFQRFTFHVSICFNLVITNMQSVMRYLGIDFGTKRIGWAVSDEEGRVAFPRDVIVAGPKTAEKIIKICHEEKIEAIVIGESKNFAGEENPIMEGVRNLIKDLSSAGFKVFLEPEFMTTAEATKIQGPIEKIDASAAAIILQSYLEIMKNVNIEMENDNAKSKIEKKEKDRISYDEFTKVEMRVGKILTAEKIPDTDKLLKLAVDFGEEKVRQIVSGIALYFPDPLNLVGRNCLFVTNLEPRVIRGNESNGMILALSTSEGEFSLLEPSKEIPLGTKVK